jgi:hypothetical protein
LKPGCALSAEQTSGRNGGDSTIGTVGGYVTIGSNSYAITVGHLFRTTGSRSNIDTIPAGSSVVANPVLAQLILPYLRDDFGAPSDIEHMFAAYGVNVGCEIIKKLCPLSCEEADNAIVPCGALVGCLFAVPNSEGKVVDVAAIRVEGPAVPFDGNGWKLYTVEEGIITIPTLEIILEEDLKPKHLVTEEKALGCKAHGYGAFTSADIEVQVTDSYKTFVVDGARHVFECFRGVVEYGRRTLRPGDSGTWFWCEDSSLLGMGIGTLGNDTMILPMTDVVTAVLDIVYPERMSKE